MTDIKNVSRKKTPIKTIRLAARVVGVIWLVVCLFGFISFFLEGSKSAPKPPDILGIATIVSFLIGFCGLIVAWWLSGIGGFISLVGFIMTAIIFKLNPNFIFNLPIFVIILLPSFLYLASWWDEKKSSERNSIQ
jgi:hypothetical protein